MKVGQARIRYRVSVQAGDRDTSWRMCAFAAFAQERIGIHGDGLARVEYEGGSRAYLTFLKTRGKCNSMKAAQRLATSHLTDFWSVEEERFRQGCIGASGYIGEITCDNSEGNAPRFPKHCPRCGAPATAIVAKGGCHDVAKYECGSAFKWKPQIQNHTNKWWFTGPCQKKAEPASV